MMITSGSTPATDLVVITATIPQVPCEEQIKLVQEQLVPVPSVEAHTQTNVDNKLGGSFIMEAQVTQVENVSCNISTSNSDAVTQEYLSIHFYEQFNGKVCSTFKELFEGINIDSMKEALPKVSIYNNIIVKFVNEIHSKYGMALMFTTLEPHEVGHWAKTFQVACGNSKAPKSQDHGNHAKKHHRSVQLKPYNNAHKQLQSGHNASITQPVTSQHLTPPSVQVQPRGITG